MDSHRQQFEDRKALIRVIVDGLIGTAPVAVAVREEGDMLSALSGTILERFKVQVKIVAFSARKMAESEHNTKRTWHALLEEPKRESLSAR
jgi:hypothetical protein